MTRTEIRWVVALHDETGSLVLFRLAPVGAALEFTAPDRKAAEQKLLASGVVLPDGATLLSRLEFDELQRGSPRRFQPGAPRRKVRITPLSPTEAA